MKSSIEKYRGILKSEPEMQPFQLSRYRPSPDLAYFVERYWFVQWDLRNREPHIQENVPNPCVNLVIEKSCSNIYGVFTDRYSRMLKHEGRVAAVKFRPGGFYPFLKESLSVLTNKSINIDTVFDVDRDAIEKQILGLDDHQRMIQIIEALLRVKLPERDENVAWINQVIDRIIDDEGLTQVVDLASEFNCSERTLQRVFKRYVGVGPKWVIDRYRIQEAVARLDAGIDVDWSGLAVDLGFYDQAHFIKKFKALVGKTPGEYCGSKHS